MAPNDPDWNALLKWSIAQQEGGGGGDGSGGQQQGDRRELTEEERRWFYEAMQSTVMNEGDQLRRDLAVVSSREASADDRVEAAEDLEELVAHIDLAKMLVKIDGLSVLLRVATSPDEESRLRSLCMPAITTTTQHNPEAQLDLLKRGALERLVAIIGSPSDGEWPLRAKAVGAATAIVKHNAIGLKQFLLAQGAEATCAAVRVAAGTGSFRGLERREVSATTGNAPGAHGVGTQDAAKLPFLRKALRLLAYAHGEGYRESSGDNNTHVGDIVAAGLASEDVDVREAAGMLRDAAGLSS